MQKRQYAHLFYNNADSYTFNNVEQDYRSGESLLDIMNRLGEEGWELVTRDDDQGYYFKRSLDEKVSSPELPR